MTTIKTCGFCGVEFKANSGRANYCREHVQLTKRYNFYKFDALKKNYPVMDHARWFEYYEGRKGMICECQECGKTFELPKDMVQRGRYYTRRFCPECKFIKKDKARKTRVSKAKTKKKAKKNPYNVTIDYSKAPEEWGLAEFMATLKVNGHGAREYINKRGYSVKVKPKSDLPEHSTIYARAIVHN